MRTKHIFVLIHIRNKGKVGPLNMFKPSSICFTDPFQGGYSLVDAFCYLCFMSVMLSCLYLADLWSPA